MADSIVDATIQKVDNTIKSFRKMDNGSMNINIKEWKRVLTDQYKIQSNIDDLVKAQDLYTTYTSALANETSAQSTNETSRQLTNDAYEAFITNHKSQIEKSIERKKASEKISELEAKLFVLQNKMNIERVHDKTDNIDDKTDNIDDIVHDTRIQDIERAVQNQDIDIDKNGLWKNINALCANIKRGKKLKPRSQSAPSKREVANIKPLIRTISDSGSVGTGNAGPPTRKAGGSYTKTLKFYQSMARARGIPFSGKKKADLIRSIKNYVMIKNIGTVRPKKFCNPYCKT
jgi:hypothetical protein